MFRSKKKKAGGRKRREANAEGESETLNEKEVVTSLTNENMASVSSETVGNDLQVLDQLRRSRSRVAAGAMTFSSKATDARSSSIQNRVIVDSKLEFEGTKLLSFDDDEEKTKMKKRKMRPNLVASSAADDDIEIVTSGKYSAELLESLKGEQNVLLSSKKEMEEVMEVEEGNDDAVKNLVQEEEEEEFISLESHEKKRRNTTNRVTFGVQSEGVSMSKTTEVVDISDGDDEDDDQNKRWEEELMRRGGHRISQPPESNGSHSRDGVQTYPTGRKVACMSLESVLKTLENNVESTKREDERASRELARLEAETILVEKTLKQQEKDLLTSSEEFEYFQEVEDFVKSLSFCLRAKIPIIKEKEKRILQDRIQRVENQQKEFMRDVVQEVKHYLNAGKLQADDISNLNGLDLYSNEDTTTVKTSVNLTERDLRLQKFQKHFFETYVADSHDEKEDFFADVVDEITSIDRVYERFQQWKAKFPQVYKDVYCDLALENLLAPYVQVEMLYWDPLSVANAMDKTWSLDEFAWFRVLHQRRPKLENDVDRDTGNVSGVILYQIRHVLVEKVRLAISSYFDPYSNLQVRSLSLVLEEIHRHGFSALVEREVETFVNPALDTFVDEAKRTVLVAIDENTATLNEDVNVFGRYLLERFNTLQDNLLTLFVALPRGPIAASGFRCLIQTFHHLLAYVRKCQETNKTKLLATATQVVRELTGSSYLLQILHDPCQERELKHMMELFKPNLHTTTNNAQ